MGSFQPGANLNTQGFGNRSENVEVPFISDRTPTVNDKLYPIGKRWIWAGNAEYVLLSFILSRRPAEKRDIPQTERGCSEKKSEFANPEPRVGIISETEFP